jgi:NAD(P)H-dependent FMN reductase
VGERRHRLAVITGSVRDGRFGTTVLHWFTEQAASRDDYLVRSVDLADFAHPATMVDAEDARAFRREIADADAIVIVTPEYNHSFPGPLKTAIDSVGRDWHAKPIGFVSYGGLSGGLRSVEALRVVFAELHAVTVRETVSFHGVWGEFDDEGRPTKPDAVNRAAVTLLNQLSWWTDALMDAKARRAYPS